MSANRKRFQKYVHSGFLTCVSDDPGSLPLSWRICNEGFVVQDHLRWISRAFLLLFAEVFPFRNQFTGFLPQGRVEKSDFNGRRVGQLSKSIPSMVRIKSTDHHTSHFD